MADRNHPSHPPLYFSADDGATTTTTTTLTTAREEKDAPPPSLQTLPPEILHACLSRYADWGDLARLACVQTRWRDIVDDAATFGGWDAAWELAMCLLHGDDGHDGGVGGDETCQSSRRGAKEAKMISRRMRGKVNRDTAEGADEGAPEHEDDEPTDGIRRSNRTRGGG